MFDYEPYRINAAFAVQDHEWWCALLDSDAKYDYIYVDDGGCHYRAKKSLLQVFGLTIPCDYDPCFTEPNHEGYFPGVTLAVPKLDVIDAINGYTRRRRAQHYRRWRECPRPWVPVKDVPREAVKYAQPHHLGPYEERARLMLEQGYWKFGRQGPTNFEGWEVHS